MLVHSFSSRYNRAVKERLASSANDCSYHVDTPPRPTRSPKNAQIRSLPRKYCFELVRAAFVVALVSSNVVGIDAQCVALKDVSNDPVGDGKNWPNQVQIRLDGTAQKAWKLDTISTEGTKLLQEEFIDISGLSACPETDGKWVMTKTNDWKRGMWGRFEAEADAQAECNKHKHCVGITQMKACYDATKDPCCTDRDEDQWWEPRPGVYCDDIYDADKAEGLAGQSCNHVFGVNGKDEHSVPIDGILNFRIPSNPVSITKLCDRSVTTSTTVTTATTTTTSVTTTTTITTITTTTTTATTTTTTITTTTTTTTTATTTTTTITTTTNTTTTATTTTTTTTTTTILPVNAVCDPHNDHCELAKGLCCDLDAYQCRYKNDGARCIGETTTASTTMVTTQTKPTTPAATKTTTTTQKNPRGSTTTTVTNVQSTTPAPRDNRQTTFNYYTIGGGAAAFLLLLLVVIWRCVRKQKLNRLQTRYGHDADDNDDDVQLLDLKSSTTTSTNNADYFDPQMTLKRKAITLGAVIGEGNFGKVHAGTAKDPRRGGGKIAVAIKSPSAHARLEFEAEMEIMGQLTRLGGHPHIVGVVGCVYGNRPLLVLEFCAGGSLKAALTAVRTFKADGGDGVAGAPSSVARFCNAGLATCGHQVALAMAFLEQHSLLHRDLAARNVLLTGQQQLECKLADFGLSRRVAPGSDYYRRTAGASAAIPVRWMAPETLEDGVSTISSDKWSFGVLLWEIYSLGLRPYIGVANHEITNHLRKGHRLEQPRGCPDEVYAGVMQPCWAASPAARPAFAVIGQRLHSYVA